MHVAVIVKGILNFHKLLRATNIVAIAADSKDLNVRPILFGLECFVRVHHLSSD